MQLGLGRAKHSVGHVNGLNSMLRIRCSVGFPSGRPAHFHDQVWAIDVNAGPSNEVSGLGNRQVAQVSSVEISTEAAGNIPDWKYCKPKIRTFLFTANR